MLKIEKTEGIFGPTLQGEGMNIGQLVSFVRFYGCDFRCKWCDTDYALGKDKGGEFIEEDPEYVVLKLDQIGVKNVVLSGGNPLVQRRKDFDDLLEILKYNYYWIQVETQGSVLPSIIAERSVDYWSISPKLWSAGVRESNNWKAVPRFLELAIGFKRPMQFKFVISDSTDYDFMKRKIGDLDTLFAKVPIILQPEGLHFNNDFDYVTYAQKLDWLHAVVCRDLEFWKRYTVRILPQLHKIIWQKTKGV